MSIHVHVNHLHSCHLCKKKWRVMRNIWKKKKLWERLPSHVITGCSGYKVFRATFVSWNNKIKSTSCQFDYACPYAISSSHSNISMSTVSVYNIVKSLLTFANILYKRDFLNLAVFIFFMTVPISLIDFFLDNF